MIRAESVDEPRGCAFVSSARNTRVSWWQPETARTANSQSAGATGALQISARSSNQYIIGSRLVGDQTKLRSWLPVSRRTPGSTRPRLSVFIYHVVVTGSLVLRNRLA